METFLTELGNYLQYPFVRHALVVGVLVALCTSLLGVSLVLRHYSFIGDGLAHVAFAASVAGGIVHLASPMMLTLPVTIACTLALLVFQRTRERGDASLAVLSVTAMGGAYLALNVWGKAANLSGDVCTALFGSTSILTLTPAEVWLAVALAAGVLLACLFFRHTIFAVTFDETFAETSGVPVRRFQALLAVLVAVVIVLAMQLVGALLVTALLVLPALAAMRLCRTFQAVLATSAALSVACALVGMLVSIVYGTPVGATIVVADAGVLAVSSILGKLLRR